VPVDDVADLLRRWRDADGVIARGRLVVEGTRLLSGLTPDERRMVAQAAADEGAPELAALLGARTGTEVDPDQLRTAADGLLSLDRDQVDHLVTSLGDPSERERLAREALDQAWQQPASPPPAPGAPMPDRVPLRPGDLEALPPPERALDEVGEVPAPSTQRDLSGVAGLHALALGEIPLDDIELGDQALGHPGLGEIELGHPELLDLDVHEVGLADLGGAGAATDTSVQQDDAPHVAPLHRSPRTAPSVQQDDAPHVAPLHPTVKDEGPGAARALPADTDAALPAPPADGDRPAALVRDLRAASSAPRRFACLRAADLDHLDAAEGLALLDALPAGWERRRLAQRLVAAGSLPTDDLATLFDRFPSRRDTVFVAGSLLDTGAASSADLVPVVDPRDLRRLAARRER
jgi:hypothetical protein